MLYQTVTERDFIRAFDDVGRGNSFSPLALRVLFQWYDDLAQDMPGGFELDPIGICCGWGEFTARELWEQYGDNQRFFRYVVDLDERGRFLSHLDLLDPVTGDVISTPYEFTETDFMEGGWLERANPYDGDEVAREVLDYDDGGAIVLGENQECTVFKDFLEDLRDNYCLLEVDHIAAETTYLFSE